MERMGCASEMIVKQVYGTPVEDNCNRKFAGRHARVCWRLDRVAHQTILWYDTNHKQPVKRRKHKVFRNPVIQAREIALTMELEGLSRANLARRFDCFRARVTQKLNLSRDLLMEIESIGDYWDRRLVTERGLRNHTSVASRPANLPHQ